MNILKFNFSVSKQIFSVEKSYYKILLLKVGVFYSTGEVRGKIMNNSLFEHNLMCILVGRWETLEIIVSNHLSILPVNIISNNISLKHSNRKFISPKFTDLDINKSGTHEYTLCLFAYLQFSTYSQTQSLLMDGQLTQHFIIIAYFTGLYRKLTPTLLQIRTVY